MQEKDTIIHKTRFLKNLKERGEDLYKHLCVILLIILCSCMKNEFLINSSCNYRVDIETTIINTMPTQKVQWLSYIREDYVYYPVAIFENKIVIYGDHKLTNTIFDYQVKGKILDCQFRNFINDNYKSCYSFYIKYKNNDQYYFASFITNPIHNINKISIVTKFETKMENEDDVFLGQYSIDNNNLLLLYSKREAIIYLFDINKKSVYKSKLDCPFIARDVQDYFINNNNNSKFITFDGRSITQYNIVSNRVKVINRLFFEEAFNIDNCVVNNGIIGLSTTHFYFYNGTNLFCINLSGSMSVDEIISIKNVNSIKYNKIITSDYGIFYINPKFVNSHVPILIEKNDWHFYDIEFSIDKKTIVYLIKYINNTSYIKYYVFDERFNEYSSYILESVNEIIIVNDRIDNILNCYYFYGDIIHQRVE